MQWYGLWTYPFDILPILELAHPSSLLEAPRPQKLLWLDLLKHDFHLIRKPVLTTEADRPFLNNLKITVDVQNVLSVLLMSVFAVQNNQTFM